MYKKKRIHKRQYNRFYLVNSIAKYRPFKGLACKAIIYVNKHFTLRITEVYDPFYGKYFVEDLNKNKLKPKIL